MVRRRHKHCCRPGLVRNCARGAGTHSPREQFEADASLNLAKPHPPRRMGPGRRPAALRAARLARDDTIGITAFTSQTARHAIAPSRRMTPECCIEHVPLIVAEGAGKTGCWPPPWPPCVRKCTGQEPQVRPVHSGLPCAMVFTVSFVLSLGIGLFCPPSPARAVKQQRELDLSVERPGPHDFSVRKDTGRLPTSPRPPHPCPDVRDDAYAPLRWDRMRASLLIFGICQGGLLTQRAIGRENRS